MGIFDICPFISLKFYQQFFHVFNLMCQWKKSPVTNSRYGKALPAGVPAVFERVCRFGALQGGGGGKEGSSHVVFSYKLAMLLSVFFKCDFSEVCVLSAVMYLSANNSLLAIMYLLALITF